MTKTTRAEYEVELSVNRGSGDALELIELVTNWSREHDGGMIAPIGVPESGVLEFNIGFLGGLTPEMQDEFADMIIGWAEGHNGKVFGVVEDTDA